MSLDIYFNNCYERVHSQNITHGLASMANAAGFYKALWHPEDNGILLASQLAEAVKPGIKKMKDNPDEFKPLSASNGWGTYEQFITWLEELLEACNEYPNAEISVSR